MRGVVNKFNRGEISKEAFTREDYRKVGNSCELIRNFMPKRLGPMMFRPGTTYIGDVIGRSYFIPFVASITDKALLEVTQDKLRVWVDDALVSRSAVTATILNGTFDSTLSGWSNTSGTGSTAVWQTGGYAALTGNGTSRAVIWQSIFSVQTGVEHGVRVVVEQAPVVLKIGTSGEDSDELFSGELLPGTHSLVITPDATTIAITFVNSSRYKALVDSIEFEAAGSLELPLPYQTSDLDLIRHDQSGDIVYLACHGHPQYQIERRGIKSWSTVLHRAEDGPFGVINTSDISMTPSAYVGDITLTASAAYFKPGHVGALFKLISYNQRSEVDANTTGTATDSIIVTGLDREFSYHVIYPAGSGSGTVVLEQSTNNTSWVIKESRTTSGTWTYDDETPNAVLYYRLRVSAYATGPIRIIISYNGGSTEGIIKVTGYTSETVVDAQVLKTISSVDGTLDWYEGEWSDLNGYPTALKLYESRLWQAGQGKLSGSVSDGWPSYDASIEGNSRAIQKTIAFGTSDNVHWLASALKLVMGLATDEVTVKSNSFSEPLTQDNCNLKEGSNQGAAPLTPGKVDDEILYVSRSGKRLFSLSLTPNDTYSATDLTMLHEKICQEGIKRIAVSRDPETRIYVVMNDGTSRVYIYDPVEEVSGWARMATYDQYEDVVVLPNQGEDHIYWVVNRNGSRYLEKQALFANAVDEHFDSAVHYTSPGTTLTGLGHLEGRQVGVWADRKHRGQFTVNSGQVSVPSIWTDVHAGLEYIADYKSNKLNRFVDGTVLSEKKRVDDFALIMQDAVLGALEVGPDESNLKPFPSIMNGATVDDTAVIEEYDQDPFDFNGDTETDPRIYIRATGPCTILALTYNIDSDPPKKDA
ncbi:MAG: hypothetical protein ABW134_11785 [Candidatus Thiodiazotropha endolucinida]